MPDEVRDSVRLYDEFGPLFPAMTRDSGPSQRLLDEFAANRSPHALILDAGCGPGRDAAYLGTQGFRVTGLDLSARMLHMARQRAPQARFVFGDLRQLPFRSGSFEGLWSFAALLHLRKIDAPQVLREFHRVLRRGGATQITLRRGSGEFWEPLRDHSDEKVFFALYEPGELNALLRDAHFSVDWYETNPAQGWVSVHATAR